MRIAAILFGIVLLIPGICSLNVLMIYVMGRSKNGLILLIPLWAVCFAISAFGIWLLRKGGKPK